MDAGKLGMKWNDPVPENVRECFQIICHIDEYIESSPGLLLLRLLMHFLIF